MEKGKARNDSVIAVLKQYGEAIRHSITKMADSPIEIIVFFDSAERLFAEIKVPDQYKVLLIKPYLNERAALLVNRLTGAEASDFEFVKKYLLDQFRLCPQFFLESFNRIQRAANETYKSFVARLTRLLQFYTRSREVDDFEALCRLLIADRVKVSLSESALKHVITVESTSTDKWLRPDVLSDVLDTYYANYQFNDKPRVSAIGSVGPSHPHTPYVKTKQVNETDKLQLFTESSPSSGDDAQKKTRFFNKSQSHTGGKNDKTLL